jgi:hypothetical protein
VNSRKLRKNATRSAIADAAATLPGTDPDRGSFAMALNAAREHQRLYPGTAQGQYTLGA